MVKRGSHVAHVSHIYMRIYGIERKKWNAWLNHIRYLSLVCKMNRQLPRGVVDKCDVFFNETVSYHTASIGSKGGRVAYIHVYLKNH